MATLLLMHRLLLHSSYKKMKLRYKKKLLLTVSQISEALTLLLNTQRTEGACFMSQESQSTGFTTTRLFLLIGSQREILEAGNIFLQSPPCNITVKPRATRDRKIPTSRKIRISLLLRTALMIAENSSVALSVQEGLCLGEYPNLWQAH